MGMIAVYKRAADEAKVLLTFGIEVRMPRMFSQATSPSVITGSDIA
jgi:hypothetical protein